MKTAIAPGQLTPDREIALIRKKLKHFTLESKVKYWLDTGSEYLNSVFGSRTMGVAYGKIYELSGMESMGKTAQMLKLAAMAQRDGATVIWVDLESSWDDAWAVAWGLDLATIYPFRPEIVEDEDPEVAAKRTKKKRDTSEGRLQTAEEIFAEVEELIKKKGRENPNGRIFLCVDSIAAMLTEEEAAAGIQGQNMRTTVSLATFLSKFLRRWVAFVRQYNVMMMFVNQLRTAPGVMYGNPEYTPGGNAVRLYASVRVRMRRRSKKILKGGQAIGIKGLLMNWKNKAGEGSREGLNCGYKLYYKGIMKYVDADDIKADGVT
jgi:recombination protein RecA